jgi:transcription antitermination factor NusG
MADRKQWHSWAIKRNRISNVVEYIQAECPEIDKYFYPQIKKEYETKRGTVTKDRPLYEGYLFLRYDNHPVVFHKLSAFPQVTTYVGTVEQHEIDLMMEAQGKLLSEIKASRYERGDKVVLLHGPFKGYEAAVISVKGENIKVMVHATLLGSPVEMSYTEAEVERKSELQNIVVQDI